MTGTKSVWESRTIWACVLALATAVMSIVNHYVGDSEMPTDALLSSYIAAISALLGIVFRATATQALTIRRPTRDLEPKKENENDDSADDV